MIRKVYDFKVKDFYKNKKGIGGITIENGKIKKEGDALEIVTNQLKIEVDPVKIETGPVTDHIKLEADPVKIENGQNRMKIRCAKCKIEDILTEEDVKLLAHIVKRYNPKPNANDYTAILSIIKGNCTDNKKHLFIFDQSFDKAVACTLKEYKDAMTANVTRKETLEKICILINETANQIKSLESNLKDLEKKKEYTLSEMNAGGILADSIKLKFTKLTGTEDISIWE